MRHLIGFFIDLFMGRLDQVFLVIDTRLRKLEKFAQENKKMTPSEQKIVEAAQSITDAADQFNTAFNAMRSKIETLIQQAQSSVPAVPEDLSQEFALLDEAVAALRTLGSTVAASVEPEAPVDAGDTSVAVPPVTEPATPVQPDTMPQPGTDPVNPAPIPPITEDPAPIVDVPADVPLTPAEPVVTEPTEEVVTPEDIVEPQPEVVDPLAEEDEDPIFNEEDEDDEDDDTTEDDEDEDDNFHI